MERTVFNFVLTVLNSEAATNHWKSLNDGGGGGGDDE
jgi:hypothetical protein